MGFLWLLFKMLFLMLLSAIGGYLLRKWIERTRYKDVTLSYTQALAEQEGSKKEIDSLNAKYHALQANVDTKLESVLGRFSPIEEKLAGVDMSAKLAEVEQQIGDVKAQIGSLPKPKDTDLTPVLSAISGIRIPEAKAPNFQPMMDAISSIHIPETKETDLSPVLQAVNNIRIPEQRETDLSPVINALESLHIPEQKQPDFSPVLSAIDGIRIPEQRETDLSPVLKAIDGIRIPEAKPTDLSPALSAIKNIKIPDNKPTDVTPVMNAIRQIKIPEAKETNLEPVLTAIRNIKVPEQKQTDLSPVLSAVRNINIPNPKETDLTPILSELKSLKAELAKRPKEKEVVKTIIKEVPSQENKNVIANRIGTRGNRLRSAAFGKPDDLKEISGVGPKLEKMLHGIGVYYFWQVADWSKADVQEADDLLDAFKGRIERDEWVKQGNRLAKLPTSTKRP